MSVSMPSAMVAYGVRATARWAFSNQLSWNHIRRRQHWITRWPGTPRSVSIQRATLGGVPVEISRPRTSDERRAVLYLHGGGYTTGSPLTHRALTGRLAAAISAAVYSLDYRLAPENPYPAAVDDVIGAYRELLEDGFSAKHIVVAGDSAGGALAVVCAIRAREEGLPIPAALGLICPAADVGHDALAAIDDHGQDAVLTRGLVERFAATYGVGVDPNHPDVSPGRGDLAGLPPLVIETASNDVLVASSRDLARRARAAGVTVRYREHHGLWHVFHLLTGLWQTADDAVDEFAWALIDVMAGQESAA